MKHKRWPVPAGLLGMLALAALFECGVAHHQGHILGLFALNCRFARLQATREALHSDVLCFGDSQVKDGVNASELGQVLNLRAYNLAVFGMQPPVSYFLLRRVLEAGGQPAAVVLGHFTLSGDSRVEPLLITELLSWRQCLEYGLSTRDTAYTTTLLCCKAMPSARLRNRLRSFVLDELADQPNPHPAERYILRGWYQARGTHLVPPNPAFDGHMEPYWAGYMYARRWWDNPLYVEYLERFLKLATAHGIKVYWLIVPIIPEAQALRDQIRYDAELTQKIREVHIRHPSVVVVDARHAGLPAKLFVDSAHLNLNGADVLTRQLARVMASGSSSAALAHNWLELPGYTEPQERRLATKAGRRTSDQQATSRR